MGREVRFVGVIGYVVGCCVLVWACCWGMSVARPLPRVDGDRELSTELAALTSRRTRRLAVAVIDLSTRPGARYGFVRADAHTRFEIGSVTKGLTGMLLAEAVERGEVAMDSTVGDVVPGMVEKPLGSVTLRELCTHTSGLPRVPRGVLPMVRTLLFGLFGIDPYRGTTPSRLIRMAAAQRLRHRGRVRYSNLGAALLGQLLAAAAGTEYPLLLADRIFTKLGMSDSAIANRDHAARHGWSSTGRPQMPWIMDGYAPAGGTLSTIGDMARLTTSLLEGSAPGHGSLTPIDGIDTGVPGRLTGMFWIVAQVPGTNRTKVWHNGQTGGYSAFLALYPQAKRAVIVLANVARVSDQERVAAGLIRWLVRTTQR